jgi:hypothetical protein
MWATVLGLMMQWLAARLGTVTGLHLAEVCCTVLIYVQAAVGVDVGNRPGSDDATVGGPAGHSHRPSSSRGLNTVLMYVQAAVGVDVGNRAGSDDATVGGTTGHSHRPS